MTTSNNDEHFILLGHRGFRGPLENTVPAFRRALRYADGIEFDVRLTGDGKLVLLHDDGFKVNGRSYSVGELTYREVIRLHPLGKLVPRLEDVLNLHPKVINADLKDLNALVPLLNTLEAKGFMERTVISTDSPEWIKPIVKECPDCRVGLSITNPKTLFESLTVRVSSIHVPLDLIKFIGLKGFKTLLKLYRRRMEVWLWNYRMNELEWFPRIFPLADAVISDDPARLKKVFREGVNVKGRDFHVG
ncbi:glycerophosphodiester phosphodiesterase family protein [Thermococcus sp.]